MMMSRGDDRNGAAHCRVGEVGRCCSRNEHCWGVDVSALWPVGALMVVLQLP